MNKLLMIAVLGALCCGPAYGRECKGINFPERTQAERVALTLNGLGVRKSTVMKVGVYVAALYVAQPSNDAGAILDSKRPAELVLQFLRNVSAGDLVKGWNAGFAANAGERLPALQERIAKLSGWMSDIRKGQSMIFSFRPGKGVAVTVAGADKGLIEGDDFAKALLSVWLGPQPPNPELKAGLLGGGCG